MADVPKVSPALQTLLDKGLFDRLPVTFSTYFFDQVKEWALLFPAERNYYERLFGLLDRSDPKRFDELFAPLRAAEARMGVNEKVWPKRTFTLDQVDFLNRSPHYPEWRNAVANIFSRIDPLLDAEIARAGRPRLVIVSTPAELPFGPDRMWLRIRENGKRVSLDLSENQGLQGHISRLLAAQAQSPKQAPYGAWLIEAGDGIAALGHAAGGDAAGGVVHLSYARLEAYRTRLMAEVRKIVEAQETRGPRQLSARLKQLRVLASETDLAHDPILAEFVRAVLLSGNGTLLINNTFVEWAAVQAVRRARPSLAVIGFGVRNKIKPFTSLLIYADQQSTTPIPNQMDALGSYVDLEIFHQYLWQEFEKYAEYRRNTVYLFVGEGLDEMLVIAPPDFAAPGAGKPCKPAEVFSQAREWLGV